MSLKGTKVNDLRLDLKVCEGCGVLWLRSTTMEEVYCTRCASQLAEFPAPRGKRAGGRPRTRVGRAAGCAAGQGVAMQGGAR